MGLKQAKWFELYLKNKPLLEGFANLEPGGVTAFRRTCPDFAPAGWWTYRPDSGDDLLWRMNQRWLREAWSAGFPLNQFDLMRLFLSVFNPEAIDLPFQTNRPTFANLFEIDTGGDYYNALVWLNSSGPWAAKVCQIPSCGRYFLAARGLGKYCGAECAGLAIRASHRESWHDHPEWNEKRKRPKKHRK